MKIKRRLMAIPALAMATMVPLAPCLAQLPATNMGKFVPQTGDHPSSVQTQMERHGTKYIDTMGTTPVYVGGPAPGAGGGGAAPVSPAYICAPPPGKGPDVSIAPITADEPIPLPGFPPMPMALDLPVTLGYSGAGGSNPGGWLKNGNGGGGGSSGGSNSGGGYQGSHQSYGHYSPGAFLPPKNGGGGGNNESQQTEASSGGNGGGGGGGGGDTGAGGSSNAPTRSGYRCGTPPPITRTGDVYGVSTGGTGKGATAAPTYGGASNGAIKGLGRAPELEGEASASGAPEAPSPVLVNQSRSQDLSLPDDDFVSNNFKDDKSKRFMKRVGKRGAQFGKQILRTAAPIGF